MTKNSYKKYKLILISTNTVLYDINLYTIQKVEGNFV